MNKVLTNMNQDLSALEKQTARSNIGAEDASNRVTSIDENSTDAQYPSAKCVFNALQNVGGGFKDGGTLVDGDFIKVENNTVSSYDNVSRDPVNFYFEVKDGEILNSVVELTTAVNATINVYVLKNGFYYLIGNVGGNTVNAGDDYKLNVVGNSFMLEVVTPSQAVPEYATIGNNIYPLLKNNNLLWTCQDLHENGFNHWTNNGRFYYSPQNIVIDGWRLPTETETVNLTSSYTLAQLKDSSGWPSPYEGNNASGFSWRANGYFSSGYLSFDNFAAFMLYKYDDQNFSGIRTQANDPIGFGISVAGCGLPVRLVHEI